MKRVALATALACTAVPALAQRATEMDTGSRIPVPQRARIPESGSMAEANRARVVMAQFARCVTDREYRKVGEAVALPLGGSFSSAVAALSTSECLDSGQIRFKPVAIRGPLFVELYRRRSDAEKSGRHWGPAVPKIDLTAPSPFEDSEQQHLAVLAFGDCVVRRNSDAARRVVLEPTTSAAQDRAIADIAPDLGPCISQGTTLRLGKQVLEGTLAEVLYRGVAAPAQAVPAAAESK